MCQWSRRVLASALAGLCTLSVVGADACDELQERWRPGMRGDIPVLVDGNETEVTVWGAGGGARAAAALLLVAVRHVLGHSARLQPGSTDLCDLASYSKDYELIIVAPTVLLPRAGCQPKALYVDRVLTLAPPASPSSIRVFAHLPGQNCVEFIRNSSIYTTVALKNCGFIEVKDISPSNGGCDKCFAVLARNESRHDDRVASELQRRIESLQLPIEIIIFQSDLLLREKVLNLRNDNKTFLFLDEDIWSDVSSVVRLYPPACVYQCSPIFDPSNAVRIGNGVIMKTFAPPISTLVNRFALEPKDLREILESELSLQSNSSIVEAACYWALKNDGKIQNWTSRNNIGRPLPRTYRIKVFLCDEDPDKEEYRNIKKYVKYRLSSDIKEINYNLPIRWVNCSDTYNFKWEIMELVRDSDLAGAVAWGPTVTVEMAKGAENNKLPFMLAGPTLPEVLLDSTVVVHAISATLVNLTRAYLELFQRCEWTRIAVLSDDTNYSKTFIQTLLSFEELLTRKRIVDTTNVNDTLEKYRKEDARIFFVNTKWDIAFIIICTAWKLGMTPDAGFMWIVRDWRSKEKCNEEIDRGNMYHYTIGSAWRGGATAGGSPELRADLRRLWRVNDTELVASADSTALAEALLLLANGFAEFLRDYPSYMYNPHSNGSPMKFSKSLSKLILNGTAQELKSKPDNRLVFIEKWFGTRGSSIATWYVDRDGVRDFWPKEKATCRQLLGHHVPDREHCATFTTGDPFAPRCHVWTITVVVAVLILAFLAIFLTRRLRLAALRRLEKEENQCVLSGLDRYLVSRDLITILYKIGEGANGKVYCAQLKTSGETVLLAAKEPRQCVTFGKMVDFLHEGYIMAPLHHENIIRLIGVCVESGRPTLLMEHAYYNDLQQYLTFRRKFAISAKMGEVTAEEAMEVSDSELTRFAREAAAALAYLAEQRLVHRDVRAANCLIDKNRTLKLADFGLARKFNEQATVYMSQRRDLFPVLCMAPETLKYGAFSPASDVWALGVLILEVATLGARPFGGWLKSQVFEYVVAGGSPPLPPDTSTYTRMLTLECWRFDKESRPSAKYIHDYLTRNPQTISAALLAPDSPDPNLYSPNQNKEIYRRNTTCDLISLPF